MNKTKIFDYGFMPLGIILQVICFLFSKDDILSFICGLSGVYDYAIHLLDFKLHLWIL